MKKAAKKAKKNNPEEIRIAENTIIEDPLNSKWMIGKRISTGAFAAVFDVEFVSGKRSLVPLNTNFVIKIEPSENGTLFTENLFFWRQGQPKKVAEWLKKMNKSSVGIPHYVISSVKEIEKVKYRYVITEKLLPVKFQEKSAAEIMKIASKLIDTVEFVHSVGYSHHDIKEDNIMLSSRTDASYLIDFGISIPFKENPEPRREYAENGTGQFMSRDAFVGMITRRSDIESLFYNLVSWLSANNLPWKDCKTGKEVQKRKEIAFDNISSFIDDLLPTHTYKKNLIEFGNYVKTLSETGRPDYDRLRKILTVNEKQTKPATSRRKIESGAANTNGNHVNDSGNETATAATTGKQFESISIGDDGGDGGGSGSNQFRMVLRSRK